MAMRKFLGMYLIILTLPVANALAQSPDPAAYRKQQEAFSAQMEQRGLAAAFKGVTTNGEVTPGLFPIEATDVDTRPVREAVTAFLQGLTDEQRAATQFSIEDDEWRKWGNQHVYLRQGIAFEAMNDTQKELAWNLLDASLSMRGTTLARDIMRLNETLGELNGNNFVEYGEGKYWLT